METTSGADGGSLCPHPSRPSACVVAVGSPMWDTTAAVDDAFLQQHNLRLGDATAVATPAALADLKAAACAASSRQPLSSIGGCASNTAKVLACLGHPAALCGGIGRDEIAVSFRGALRACGLHDLTRNLADDAGGCAETGEVLCLVTPCGERTFAYLPGASATLTAAGLRDALRSFVGSHGGLALMYLDAYTLLCPGAMPEEGMASARQMGALVALNMGSQGIVASMKERLWSILQAGLCDAVFMNESEAKELCGTIEGADSSISADGGSISSECACKSVAALCQLTVVTLGVRGAWISASRGAAPEFHSVPPADGVVDSTGAGDFFAGGFLSAWLRGQPMATCMEWGAAAAVSVLGVFGTDLGDDGRETLRARLLRE